MEASLTPWEATSIAFEQPSPAKVAPIQGATKQKPVLLQLHVAGNPQTSLVVNKSYDHRCPFDKIDGPGRWGIPSKPVGPMYCSPKKGPGTVSTAFGQRLGFLDMGSSC